MTKLSRSVLDSLDPALRRPGYDPAALTPGILHVGLGNFHRAHQGVYLDDLFCTGRGHDWAILGAGVRPADSEMRAALAGQDWLYTVTEEDATTTKSRVIAAMSGFAEITPGHRAIRAAIADPQIRIVSLTVTEGGYYVDSATGHFDPEHPDIRADIANPDSPTTVFGAIVAGLAARRASGMAPFTVMSCDNLPHNGAVTRAAVLGLAAAQDDALAQWIEDKVAFPNGMVDRITPATDDARRASLEGRTGIEDARPVFCEPFRQWVLEDKFCQGRPALEDVGVQFVSDVAPYELMKIRILNGGHALIAYPAGLMDIRYVHEAMQNPLVAAFLDKVQSDEIIPVVPPVPDTSLQAYKSLIQERFANTRIGDTISRLCFDGSNRQPKFIIPSVSDSLANGRVPQGLALASALWCRYCVGTTDSGAAIGSNDPSWDRLTERAAAAREDPAHWLAMSDIYGETGKHPGFRDAFAIWLRGLYSDGTAATLKRYIKG